MVAGARLVESGPACIRTLAASRASALNSSNGWRPDHLPSFGSTSNFAASAGETVLSLVRSKAAASAFPEAR